MASLTARHMWAPSRHALKTSSRGYASSSSSPRHLFSIADLTPAEFTTLVKNARTHKQAIKSTGRLPAESQIGLAGKTVALMFSKRSTRTRVSTEAGITHMGGHTMFLGKEDIQLGVNESLLDTSKIISSMTSCMVARVGPHSDVTGLAEHSTVPVINALSADAHPLQTIADYLTIAETFAPSGSSISKDSLGIEGLKIAWVGDANNVLYDLAIGALKTGVEISVATPEGYGIPSDMLKLIKGQAKGVTRPGSLTTTTVPEEAIKGANIIVTDTWVSMGQEEETARRLKAFASYRITNELIKKGGASEDWKFMHCLPRHPEEVDDEVFYSNRSLVFPEGENRLYAATSALESFVVKKGKII